VSHLNALAADSLPLTLAHTILSNGCWQGLGLLSGSRLPDLILTLAAFNTRYKEGRWRALLQAAVPACTEQDAQWLTALPAPVDSPLPAPQSQTKRKASGTCGSDGSNKKSPTVTQRAPIPTRLRWSHQQAWQQQFRIHDEAPSQLADSHRNIRPQLSQAFRRLYGRPAPPNKGA
jgi:hypothetical protein